jgi:ubiquinone/menaquinone biosynthesis C-methylase UbiE
MERLPATAELLDGPLEVRALEGNLRDLERVNRWLGGTGLSRRALAFLARSAPGSPHARHEGGARSLRMIDVGTGAADIPAALLGWSDDHGLDLEVEAVDEREEIIAAARARAPERDDLRLVLADGRHLPYPDDAFDIAHASLVLHHLEPPAAIGLLAEMARTASLGVIVNDLDRGRVAWLGAWALTRIATRNPYTRHDAPLSVRRAYRPAEVAEMASQAGLVEVDRHRGFLGHRYALAFVRDGRDGVHLPPRADLGGASDPRRPG